MDRAAHLIESLQLSPHPEGGWYRQVHRSENVVQPNDDRGPRRAITAIYFLLRRGERSAPHRVRSDEIWTFLEGDPIALTVGDEQHMLSAENRMIVVPANVWQSAILHGDYALVACFVGPGFEFEDFEMEAER